MVLSLIDKQGYGIKREALPPSRNRVCKDCNKGILFRYWDYNMNAMVERCQTCPIFRILVYGNPQGKPLNFETAKDL